MTCSLCMDMLPHPRYCPFESGLHSNKSGSQANAKLGSNLLAVPRLESSKVVRLRPCGGGCHEKFHSLLSRERWPHATLGRHVYTAFERAVPLAQCKADGWSATSTDESIPSREPGGRHGERPDAKSVKRCTCWAMCGS